MARLSVQFQLRGYGLSLLVCCPMICWWMSFPIMKSFFCCLLPIVLLIILDIRECREVKRRFALEVASFTTNASSSDDNDKNIISSLARNGRDNMSKKLPKQTDKTYLVVGTGGVGRRIIEILKERGEKHVYGFDICSYCDVNEFLPDESYFIKGDVSSCEECIRVVKKIQPNVIYHNAAIVGYSQHKSWQWDKIYNVNVKGVHNMLLAATTDTDTTSKVESFILTSSSTAGLGIQDCYKTISGGEDKFQPVDSKKDSLSWYTCTKAMAEIEALSFCNKIPTKPIAIGIIRPASGIYHARDRFLCQSSIMDTNCPATGFEYQVIDYVYVDNVVLGHLLLEEQLSKGKCHGETFIISNQEPMPAMQLFAQLAALLLPDGYHFIYWKLSSTLIFILSTVVEILTSLQCTSKWVPNDLAPLSYTTMTLATINYTMDSTKAEQMIGYKPAFTVQQGLAQTIENHIQYFPDGQLAKKFRENRNGNVTKKKDD